MKLLVLGDGQMGRAVVDVARDRGHQVGDPAGRATAGSAEAWVGVDVAIDFSVGSGVRGHAESALEHGVALVVGTTGWEADFEYVCEQFNERGGTLVWGANFSIGYHILENLTRLGAQMVRQFPELDAAVFEHHHLHKRDSPSGSALMLAKTLLEELAAKTTIQAGNEEGPIDKHALHVTSLRAGAEPGLHRVHFDGAFESIVLEHRVRDRTVFATGAVFGAEQAMELQGVVPFGSLVSAAMTQGGGS